MIFDCFTFYNELDLLDARLHEMSPVVDRFVLVEATTTFQGVEKPLYYGENKGRFDAFSSKIVHVVVDFPATLQNKFARERNQTWAREYYQRDQIACGLAESVGEDLVIVADVDEIISADALKRTLRDRPRHSLVVFEMPSYLYYVNRRAKRRSTWMLGPRMIERSRFRTCQKLRMAKPFTSKRFKGALWNRIHTRLYNRLTCEVNGRVHVAEDSGWHFSSIGGWQNYRDKVLAYSHAEHRDLAIFNSEDAFVQNLRATTVEVGESEMPRFMRERRDRFPLYPG